LRARQRGQSLLAGIGLKLAGVPHAGVLAFLVLILAILQIGPAIVLVPDVRVKREFFPLTYVNGPDRRAQS